MVSIVTQQPLLSTVVISLILTIITTIVYKYTTDQVKLKSHREELQSIRKQMMDSKNDPKKLEELQSRSLKISMEQMTQGFKPMIFTMLPALLAFGFLKDALPASQVILPFGFNIIKIGSHAGFGWLGVYIISSMIFSTILRKVLKVY